MSQDLRYLQNITIIDDLEQLYEDKNEEAGQNSNAKSISTLLLIIF